MVLMVLIYCRTVDIILHYVVHIIYIWHSYLYINSHAFLLIERLAFIEVFFFHFVFFLQAFEPSYGELFAIATVSSRQMTRPMLR